MIYTGECEVSEEARQAFRRAGARALSKGRRAVGQEDLLVAILQCASAEAGPMLAALPRLRALSVALRGAVLARAAGGPADSEPDVEASRPLQTSIELAGDDGRITAATLLAGLLKAPRTHLLKLLARELENAESLPC